MRPRKLGWTLASLAGLAVVSCLSHSDTWTVAEDQQVMDLVTSSWTSATGLALSLCEDVATADATVENCQYEHVVMAGTRAHPGSFDMGPGCGGCPLAVAAFVSGHASGGGLTGDVQVQGQIILPSAYDDDQYKFPYQLDLTCAGIAGCTITGDLAEDGTIDATLTLGGVQTHHILQIGAAATCTQ